MQPILLFTGEGGIRFVTSSAAHYDRSPANYFDTLVVLIGQSEQCLHIVAGKSRGLNPLHVQCSGFRGVFCCDRLVSDRFYLQFKS